MQLEDPLASPLRKHAVPLQENQQQQQQPCNLPFSLYSFLFTLSSPKPPKKQKQQ